MIVLGDMLRVGFEIPHLLYVRRRWCRLCCHRCCCRRRRQVVYDDGGDDVDDDDDDTVVVVDVNVVYMSSMTTASNKATNYGVVTTGV